ncbi:MAG: HD domain-containing protein [Muribaculaceae bacterium]|nr:HD domain-containing protein [Muribaculaceae bacterium]
MELIEAFAAESDRNQELTHFLLNEIVPRYDAFDAGHDRHHALYVMTQSLHLAQFYPEVYRPMVLTAAAYHDLGLVNGREQHHADSAKIIRSDERLQQWFTSDEVEVIAQAAYDHRASAKTAPASIYGRIVAEADRQIEVETVIRRTIQFGMKQYPQLSKEESHERTAEHLREKYGEGGYLKLWIPESDNAQRLAELRAIIADEPQLRTLITRLYHFLRADS